MTSTLLDLGRAVATAAPMLGLACGALPRFSAEHIGCRTTVDVNGGAAAEQVQWVHIDDDEDRAFQNAWCAGVGPALYYAAPQPVGEEVVANAGSAAATSLAEATSEEPVLDSLLVVAFNVHIGMADLDRFVADIRSGELTGAPVSHFVLLLQEAHREGMGVPEDEDLPADVPHGSAMQERGRVTAVEWAQALGLNLIYVPSMRSGIGIDPPEDRGNAIMSTLPLDDVRGIELPAGLQRRVAVVAELEGRTSAGNRWTLNVASAHLDNASLSSPLASLGSVRARQASGLVRMLPSEGPLLVAGDFNTWLGQEEERAWRIMRDEFPLPRQHQTQPTAIRLGAGRIIDWMWFRGPAGWTIRDARAPDWYGSDHYAVYAWVRIPPDGYEP